MFSVNINKLVAMTDKERDSYTSLADTILADSNDVKSLSVLGGGVKAFKLAYILMKKGKKVLFIDGDISSDVFLGKYKLGKDMKGISDYANNPCNPSDLLCLTNEAGLKIVFTGSSSALMEDDKAKSIQKLFESFSDEFDYFVVDSDNEATLGKYCGATAVIIDEADYSESYAESLVDELEDKGCNVLGVIINE